MSKRKLTRKQQWRIEKIQEERIKRSQERAERTDALFDASSLGPEQEGLVVAHFGTQVEIENPQRHRYRCVLRANIPAVVTGDRVAWRLGSDELGVIEALYPRKSSLSRPDSRGQLKIIAANIDYIIIVIAPLPEPSSLLIDRYLVAAELATIEPILLLNKMDLLDETGSEKFNELIERYQSIGYKVASCSTRQTNGLLALQALLEHHSFVFVGQSGVGKSSIVNALLPGTGQQTGALSNSQLGTHTTTTARLFHTTEGGYLIDSPGIREFGLDINDHIELSKGFKEFDQFLGLCQFRDCKHDREPGCAIKNAVLEGKVHAERLGNYLTLCHNLAN